MKLARHPENQKTFPSDNSTETEIQNASYPHIRLLGSLITGRKKEITNPANKTQVREENRFMSF